jgi:hypothetical protein
MTIRAHRFVAAGALAVAAVAAPIAIALTSVDAASNAACRATFTTNGSDPVCLDGPDNGNSFTIGSPDFGTYGPNGQFGARTGPLLPGQTWNTPLG